MDNVKFTATRLQGTGKKGELKPDANGYYDMVIGGLNSFNSSGQYYVLEGAKDLFEQSSVFMRRVQTGCLKGELGHPKRAQGQSLDDYINRILTIDEANVVAHFSEIWLDHEFGKNNPKYKNPDLVAIMAKVKPSGPRGPQLKASLENSQENVCFSIRALTRDYYQRGQTYRVLQQIVCWDQVTEPGIDIARKWDSPALECLEDCVIREKALQRILTGETSLVATESTKALAQESLELFRGPGELRLTKLPLISQW